MHRLRILLTTALLFAATSAAVFAQGVEPGQSFTGKVTSVIDGDTYKVDRPVGPVVKVRLWGVDAPETAQPYGTAATRAARHLVGGESVRAHVEEIGRYGRAVDSLEVQGSDLGTLLVRRGLGWWYREYAPRETEYARLQRQARNASRGLWSQADPVPP
jgi:endonuclease YncB( thermonuclease family)